MSIQQNSTQQTFSSHRGLTAVDALSRSLEMQLMHESLARAHCQQVLADAERTRRQRRLVAAVRAQRKAERAVARANRLLSCTVVAAR
ncbi:MAG: hypothetical protein ACTHOD_11765 [Motilibacteraceae bacterium]